MIQIDEVAQSVQVIDQPETLKLKIDNFMLMQFLAREIFKRYSFKMTVEFSEDSDDFILIKK